MKRLRLLLPLALGFLAIGVWVAYLAVRTATSSWNPSEPVASGEFPSQPVWIFDAGEPVVSSPVVLDGRAFIRTQHSLYAINATNGEEIWHVPTLSGDGRLAISPVIVGELVLVPEGYSGLAAFSGRTGQLAWRIPPLEVSKDNPGTASIRSIATNDGRAYVARFDWVLEAYQLDNGKSLWQSQIEPRSFPDVSSDQKKVYLASGSDLTELSPQTGEVLSEKDFHGYLGPIFLENNMLFLSDEEKNMIYALSTTADETRLDWSTQLPEDLETFEINCLSADDKALYVAANRLIAIAKDDGHILWITEGLGRLECPAFLDDRIYVRNTGNDLYAIDPKSGLQVGQLKIRENTVMKAQPFRSPAASGNLLLVPFGDGRIFAYHP